MSLLPVKAPLARFTIEYPGYTLYHDSNCIPCQTLWHGYFLHIICISNIEFIYSMAFLIIALTVTLVLGSALWVLPSPRERGQMAMRREAMLKGLQVKLTKIKDREYPGEQIQCIEYGLAHRRAQGLKLQTWMLYRQTENDRASLSVREAGISGWFYDRDQGSYRFDDSETMSMLLAQLPEDVMAVQCTVGALSVYWQERGEMDDVAAILTVLTGLQNC